MEKVYLRHDWSGLNEGQQKFARDDQGQKAFSKLRSSIGGVYAWRINPVSPPPVEYRPKTEAEIRRIYKGKDMYALVRADKTLYRVKKGNYMGQNFGLITDVSESDIKLKEIVQDSAGDWAERQSVLPLLEETGKGDKK